MSDSKNNHPSDQQRPLTEEELYYYYQQNPQEAPQEMYDAPEEEEVEERYYEEPRDPRDPTAPTQEYYEEDYVEQEPSGEDFDEQLTTQDTVFNDGKGLCATGLAKSYKKRKVVSDVSLNVHRGEAVGLLGPNGAGKTTSFYMIVGLVQPDHGSITLDRANITQLPMYRRARLGVGYLPQEASIFRGLNVEQNIMAALEVIESDPDKRQEMLDQLLDEFGITRLRKSPSLALSGGERRRLEIARALASQPNYILLDEPFAGVDPIAVSEIRELVSHLKDRGIGVLITDHNVRETLGVIDRAYIMHSGTVLTQGLPEEIVQHEGVRRVYLGENFSL